MRVVSRTTPRGATASWAIGASKCRLEYSPATPDRSSSIHRSATFALPNRTQRPIRLQTNVSGCRAGTTMAALPPAVAWPTGSALVEDRRADAAGPEMGSDRRADDRHRHVARIEPRPADHFGPERVDIRRHRVEDRDPLDRPGGDQLDAALARLRARPGLVRRLDLAVLDGDDRLDRQDPTDRRLGPADPAALLQVLEGLERHVHPEVRCPVV